MGNWGYNSMYRGVTILLITSFWAHFSETVKQKRAKNGAVVASDDLTSCVAHYPSFDTTPGDVAAVFFWRGTKIMGILATPPKATPPRNNALLRVY